MWRAAFVLAALGLSTLASAGEPIAPAMDAAVAARDFSGAVLVVDRGRVVFDKAYGLADRDAALGNRTTTSFRVGSLTRLYIATEVVLLAGKHKLAFTNTAEQFAEGDGATSVGDLLVRRDDSATPVLGRVLSGAAHEPLADALDDLFSRLWMTGSALDTGDVGRRLARSYRAAPAPAVVAYSTTRDVLRWTDAIFAGDLVSPEGRRVLLATWANSGDSWEAASEEAAIIVQSDRNRTVVVLANGGTAVPAEIAARLAELLPNGQPAGVWPVRAPLDAEKDRGKPGFLP